MRAISADGNAPSIAGAMLSARDPPSCIRHLQHTGGLRWPGHDRRGDLSHAVNGSGSDARRCKSAARSLCARLPSGLVSEAHHVVPLATLAGQHSPDTEPASCEILCRSCHFRRSPIDGSAPCMGPHFLIACAEGA